MILAFRTLLRRAASAIPVLLVLCSVASATDIRIVDNVGLVRGVKLVKGPATVTIESVAADARCTAVSVDGISSERTVNASQGGACVFPELPPGTWQVQVSAGSRWKVRIDG